MSCSKDPSDRHFEQRAILRRRRIENGSRISPAEMKDASGSAFSGPIIS
jgi:hypothetical protein